MHQSRRYEDYNFCILLLLFNGLEDSTNARDFSEYRNLRDPVHCLPLNEPSDYNGFAILNVNGRRNAAAIDLRKRVLGNARIDLRRANVFADFRFFDFDSDVLKDAGMAELDKLANQLNAAKEYVNGR